MIINTCHGLTMVTCSHDLTDILDLASICTTWGSTSTFRDKVSASKTEAVTILVKSVLMRASEVRRVRQLVEDFSRRASTIARPHSTARSSTARACIVNSAAPTPSAGCATFPFRFVFQVSQFAFQIPQGLFQFSLLLLMALPLNGSFAPLIAKKGCELVNDGALLRLGLQCLLQLPL